MNDKVRAAMIEEMEAAAVSEHEGDLEAAWRALERAHILSQRWTWPHLRVHAAMFALAWRSSDGREVVGQILRLALAAPGSLLGRAPLGNTGRSNVGIFRPMPIDADLAAILADSGEGANAK
jgi:hypothetical protein